MLTSFFGNSKPINYVILSLYIVVFSIIKFPGVLRGEISWTEIPFLLGTILTWVFAMLLMDFIIRKNQITQTHTLGIFVFACMVGLISETTHWQWLAALLFLLLALRRICSLRSSRNREKKILDATLWTLVASFFFSGAICFLLPLYIALFQLNKPKLRYFFIPIVVATAVALMIIAYSMWISNDFSTLTHWWKPIKFDFGAYNSTKQLVIISIMLALFVWCYISFLFQIPKQAKKHRSFYYLISIAALVFLIIPLLIPQKDGQELIFWSISGSLIIAPYLENKRDLIFKEIIAFILFLLPIVVLFLN